ncbi:Zinc transporter 1 [Nymphon striatum]|nr:Zinc transporter 1 [Nymphon striatum]
MHVKKSRGTLDIIRDESEKSKLPLPHHDEHHHRHHHHHHQQQQQQQQHPIQLLSIIKIHDHDKQGQIKPPNITITEDNYDIMNKSTIARVIFMVTLSTLYFFGSLIASHYCASVLLLTGTYQCLYNVVSMVGDLIHAKMSLKSSSRNIFGWMRIKLLSLLISTLILGSFCFSLFVEAVQETVDSSHSHGVRHPFILLLFGVIGVIINLISFFIIGGYTNYQQRFFTIEKDLLLVKTDLMMPEIKNKEEQTPPQKDEKNNDAKANNNNSSEKPKNHHFLIESGMILMQTIPKHIDLTSLRKNITQKFPTVLSVHDFHIWQLSPSQTIATLHVIIEKPSKYVEVSQKITDYLKENGISSVTIQPEFNQKTILQQIEDANCLLDCKDSDLCKAKTCCGPQEEGKSDLRKRHVSYTHDIETGESNVIWKTPMVIAEGSDGQMKNTLNKQNIEERVEQVNSGKVENIGKTFQEPSTVITDFKCGLRLNLSVFKFINLEENYAHQTFPNK